MNDGEQQGRIHSENPFMDAPEARSPARRLRGRLPAPVTLWTAGSGSAATGLTVSSVMIADGAPGMCLGLISPNTELLEVIEETGRWVVHVLEQEHKELSERFAGARPSPGGLFTGLRTRESEHGPVIESIPTRALCSLAESSDAGYHRLFKGMIDDITFADEGIPLAHLRGRYRQLDPG